LKCNNYPKSIVKRQKNHLENNLMVLMKELDIADKILKKK